MEYLNEFQIREKVLSTNLSFRRKSKEISVSELSKLSGVSVNKIRKFEDGSKVPTAIELYEMCSAMRVSIDDIFVED